MHSDADQTKLKTVEGPRGSETAAYLGKKYMYYVLMQVLMMYEAQQWEDLTSHTGTSEPQRSGLFKQD